MPSPTFEPTDDRSEIGKFLVEVPVSFVANPKAIPRTAINEWMEQNRGRVADRQITRRQHEAVVLAPLGALHVQGAVRQLNSALTRVRIMARQGLDHSVFEAAFRDPAIPATRRDFETFRADRRPGAAEVTTLAATMRYLSMVAEVPMPTEPSLRASMAFAMQPAIRDMGRVSLARQAPSLGGPSMSM